MSFVSMTTSLGIEIGAAKVPFDSPSVYLSSLTVILTVFPSTNGVSFSAVRIAHLSSVGLYLPVPPIKSLGSSLVPHQLSLRVMEGVDGSCEFT